MLADKRSGAIAVIKRRRPTAPVASMHSNRLDACNRTASRADPYRRTRIGASAHRRYARHRPEESLLYTIVTQHADAFFEHLSERDAMLPGFVRDEFDAYLRCGRLEHG